MIDKKEKTLALVTTIYNDKNYIKRLLDSLVAQTKHNFVHYLFEDGSNQNLDSESLVEEYKNKTKNKVIYIKSKNNVGVNKGHSILFNMVEEDYFCWVDSDDWVDSMFVETIHFYIRKKPRVDVFHINSWHYYENGKRFDKTTMDYFDKKCVTANDQFPAYCLNGQRFWDNYVVKVSTIKKINPFFIFFESKKNEHLWYDAQLLIELSIIHANFYLIKEPLSNILVRLGSVSRNIENNDYTIFDNQKDVFSMILDKITFNDKDVLFCRELIKASKHYYNALNSYNKDYDIAWSEYKIYRSIIVQKKLKKNYIFLTKTIPFMLYYKRYSFIFKVRRFFKNIISKTKGLL